MTLTALKTFLAIVETGSLVRASKRLNVTQSTVTARLKGLEDDLGQRLLHREKSGVQLTAAGVKFLRYARTMSELWRQARQEVSLPEGIASVCNIGCQFDLWSLIGRRLFNLIQTHHPEIACSVWPGSSEDLDGWLRSGLVDVALSYRPSSQDGVSSRVLLTEDLILVSTDPSSPVRFDPGYVFVDAGEEFGRRHAAAYADADTAKISFGSSVWALDHLLDHGGSAYLPESLVKPRMQTGQLHRIGDAPVFARKTYLCANDTLAGGWPWLEGLLAKMLA